MGVFQKSARMRKFEPPSGMAEPSPLMRLAQCERSIAAIDAEYYTVELVNPQTVKVVMPLEALEKVLRCRFTRRMGWEDEE